MYAGRKGIPGDNGEPGVPGAKGDTGPGGPPGEWTFTSLASHSAAAVVVAVLHLSMSAQCNVVFSVLDLL